MRPIDGVRVEPLRIVQDERGKVMHMLREDSPHFERFGEIYFSLVYPDVIKGWHLHKEMVLNYAVVLGVIKLVLFDDRPGSATNGVLQELYPGEQNYVLVRVPPGVWNGFKAVGAGPALVANCSTMPHHPDEIVRMDPLINHIPYDWSLKHR